MSRLRYYWRSFPWWWEGDRDTRREWAHDAYLLRCWWRDCTDWLRPHRRCWLCGDWTRRWWRNIASCDCP